MNIDEVLNHVERLRQTAIEKSANLRDEIVKVSDIDLTGMKIGSVDGGLLKKSYHPFDVVIVTSMGVVYSYEGKEFSVSYFPSKIPKKNVEFYVGNEFKFFSNLTRVRKELETSLKLLENFELSTLILDGSIVPHPSLKPSQDSELYPMYEEVLEMYEKMYELCRKGCLLAGVVKDSRSSHYFDGLRDTFVLSFALKGGERTKSFKYQETNVSDVKSREEIFSFYLRANDKSRPIRVDFLREENENKIGNIIYTLSKFSSVGIPSVILECDKRVKLHEMDLLRVEKKLFSKLPRNLFLRRNGRLF